MNAIKLLRKYILIRGVSAVVGALAINAAIGWTMQQPREGQQMLALHPAAQQRIAAHVEELPAVTICAKRLPA